MTKKQQQLDSCPSCHHLEFTMMVAGLAHILEFVVGVMQKSNQIFWI